MTNYYHLNQVEEDLLKSCQKNQAWKILYWMNGDSSIYYLIFRIEYWMVKYWIKKKIEKIQQIIRLRLWPNNHNCNRLYAPTTSGDR